MFESFDPKMAANHGNVTLLYGCDGEVPQLIQHGESLFFSIILISIILIAIHGNLLVIISIIKYKSLQNPRNVLLCSLAFTDLLSPLTRLLPIAISTIQERWVLGCLYCAISAASGVFFCSASILHLCLITVERYISIRWPLRSKLWITERRACILLVLVWFFSLLMGLIPYFTSSVDLYFNNKILFCNFYLAHHPYLSIVMTALFFCLPFFLMLLVYYRIYRKIVVNNRRIVPNIAVSQQRKNDVERRMKQEWNAVKMVIVVVAVFFGLWLPYFSVACIKSYHPTLLPPWVERGALTIAYFNPCCNFVVYCIMNMKLREAFRKLIWCESQRVNPP